jgi:hypothetical protein
MLDIDKKTDTSCMEIVTSVKFKDSAIDSPNSFHYDIQILKQFALQYNLKLHIYSKNTELPFDAEERVIEETPTYRIIEIPDIGRCDYAFFYHIVKHYDHLPEHLFFTKSNINNRILDDDVNFPLFLYKYKYLNFGQHLKLQVYGENPDFVGLPIVPREDIEIHIKSYKRYQPEGDLQSYATMDFFEMVYGEGAKMPDTWVGVEFGHGPSFRVCRELIHRHPKCIYENLLNAFHPNQGHWSARPHLSLSQQLDAVGKIYHDNLLRFWTLLFTYGLDMICETDFKTIAGFFKEEESV